MNGYGESDRPILSERAMNNVNRVNGGVVREKWPDQEECTQAKQVPYTETDKDNDMVNLNRAQSRKLQIQTQGSTYSHVYDLQNWRERIRMAASKDKKMKFTSLWHHVYNVTNLKDAYFNLKRKAAAGIDDITWEAYGEQLEENLNDLSARLRRGAYRAKVVKRVYIPKTDGRKRPIGIPVLEDKIVQRATSEVLRCVYEEDFKGFSYGFRPNRSQHDALDALSMGIYRKKISFVLDADIHGFFDAIDHECMIRFIKHRIADERLIRHIKKWLNAGVLEDGVKSWSTTGTPQGGSISPILANIYLHYVADLWLEHWRNHRTRGDIIIVRFADDIVLGFQYETDGHQIWKEMQERLRKFGLELNEGKTRLIEFGRFAKANSPKRGETKPETFNFLGFTHTCGESRKGNFVIKRQTIRQKQSSKLKDVRRELRRRMHLPIPEIGKWLKSVLLGHYRYYGVPGNNRCLSLFKYQISRSWFWTLKRRSQRYKRDLRNTIRCLADKWLPNPRIYHPYPWERLCVTYSR